MTTPYSTKYAVWYNTYEYGVFGQIGVFIRFSPHTVIRFEATLYQGNMARQYNGNPDLMDIFTINRIEYGETAIQQGKTVLPSKLPYERAYSACLDTSCANMTLLRRVILYGVYRTVICG